MKKSKKELLVFRAPTRILTIKTTVHIGQTHRTNP